MHSGKGEKCSGSQLWNILSLKLFLPSLLQPTAGLPPCPFLPHTCLDFLNVLLFPRKPTSYLPPSFFSPTFFCFLLPWYWLQFPQRISICLSPLLKTHVRQSFLWRIMYVMECNWVTGAKSLSRFPSAFFWTNKDPLRGLRTSSSTLWPNFPLYSIMYSHFCIGSMLL